MKQMPQRDTTFAKQADLILAPLLEHIKKLKVEVEIDSFMAPPTPHTHRGTDSQHRRHLMH
jgi:hypothetical protein